ncbi:hypothetical protein [Streptomyces sp. NPDC001068]|uniref:hypothetical protein n=1 Tax=Streptomyces sp. NPDC001068 TaxID=3364544 RepID=UPI0036A95858
MREKSAPTLIRLLAGWLTPALELKAKAATVVGEPAGLDHQVPEHLLGGDDLLDRPGGQQGSCFAGDRLAVA